MAVKVLDIFQDRKFEFELSAELRGCRGDFYFSMKDWGTLAIS
jgi:hypothetical protein